MRRYNDEEAARIFLKAAEGAQAPALLGPGQEGMTLDDLQQIGQEAGIPAAAVAQAALTLDQARAPAPPRFLGLRVGVERSINLPHKLSEAEWEQLVVELREVFRARGTVSAHGSFRQWTNGNLQALLEPTPEGHRLVLRTYKGNARPLIGAGLATLGVTATMMGTAAVAGNLAGSLPSIVFISALGAGMLGYAIVPLGRWARQREQQMDTIIARLAATAAEPR